MADRPSETITFLFTDIEESTRLWERSPEVMNDDLARHDRRLHPASVHHLVPASSST